MAGTASPCQAHGGQPGSRAPAVSAGWSYGATCTGPRAQGALHRPFAWGGLHRQCKPFAWGSLPMFAQGELHGECKPFACGICTGQFAQATCKGQFAQAVCTDHLHDAVCMGFCTGHLHRVLRTGSWHRFFAQGSLHGAFAQACLQRTFAQTGIRWTDIPWGRRSLRAGLFNFTSKFSNLTPSPETFRDAPQVVPPHPGLASRGDGTGLESRSLPVDVPLSGRTNGRDCGRPPQGFPVPENIAAFLEQQSPAGLAKRFATN